MTLQSLQSKNLSLLFRLAYTNNIDMIKKDILLVSTSAIAEVPSIATLHESPF